MYMKYTSFEGWLQVTTTTTFVFCLTGLFSSDYSKLGQVSKEHQRKTFGYYWSRKFTDQDALPIAQSTVPKHTKETLTGTGRWCIKRAWNRHRICFWMMHRVISVQDLHRKLATAVEQLHKNSGSIWWWNVVEYIHRTQKWCHSWIVLYR